jgi:hypothetical protein
MGGGPRRSERWHEQSQEKRNDPDDHEQLDERESTFHADTLRSRMC